MSSVRSTWLALRLGRNRHALSGAYALDALDRGERARFERHLTSCAVCRTEVVQFAEVAAELGRAVAVAPPPALKGRIMTDAIALLETRSIDEDIIALLSAPDALIASAATSAGGFATVVASLEAEAVVFTSAGLPVLPPASAYELWFISPAGARPAGLVPAVPAPVLASGLSGGDAIGVTVEPARGSPAPTTKPIVVLALGS